MRKAEWSCDSQTSNTEQNRDKEHLLNILYSKCACDKLETGKREAECLLPLMSVEFIAMD